MQQRFSIVSIAYVLHKLCNVQDNYNLFPLFLSSIYIQINQSFISEISPMIRHTEDDYYIYQPQIIQKEQPLLEEECNDQQTILEQIGNNKQKLQLIRKRISELKVFKENKLKQKSDKQKSALNQLTNSKSKSSTENFINMELHIIIPEQFLRLEKRIQILQQKIQPNEAFKQRIEKKGNLVDRIKLLQKKIEGMIEKRSPEITINHIQNYCNHFDQKEENMKPLFLYETLQKTQSMKEQMEILEIYLTNLSKIQLKVNGILPLEQMVKDHNQIIIKADEVEIKTQNLFNFMKSQYEKLMKEIEAIDI